MADKGGDKPADAPKEEKKDGGGEAAGGAGGAGGAAIESGFVHKTLLNTKKDFAKMYLNSDKEKKFLEQMRRWKVVIKEIYITPIEEMFDPFIQFTIGGDYGIEVFINTKRNKKIKKVNGERGFSDKTEVLRDCNVGTRYKFEKEIDIELRDTIVNLMKQNILVEVWDWDQWSLNNLDGFQLFDIYSIIKGNMLQSCVIDKIIDEKLKKPHAKVEFKIVFQEMWDFVLSFEDWAASNVDSLFNNQPDVNCGIQFNLSGDQQSIENKDFKKGSNPQWSNFTGEILFRGTENDLEAQRLEITLENVKEMNLSLGASKPKTLTDLNGVTTDGLVKTFMINENAKDDDLETMVRGKINVNTLPKYKQQGLDSVIAEDEIYLIVRVGKLLNFNTPNFVKVPVSVYISVEWNGKTYETRRILIQQEKKYDQELNYLFGISKDYIGESLEKRTNVIKSNLKLKNEVIVKLWLEDSYKCQDFLGQFQFYLIDIFERGLKDIREFKRDDKVIPYYTRVLIDKSQFESSYTKQENYILDYEAWFYPSSFTNAVELCRDDIKKSNRGDPINELVEKIIGEDEKNLNQLTFRLDNSFENFKQRFFSFNSDETKELLKVDGEKLLSFYVVDQIGKKRFLNSYLSKLTIKGFKFDMSKYNDEIKKMIDDKEFIPKIKLPINTPFSLLHYVKCMRYVSNQNDDYLLSPDCFMLNKKGSNKKEPKFKACLMMNMYSSQYTLPDSDDEDDPEADNENKNLELNKDNYAKLDDIKEVDNKLEVEDDKKADKKGEADKDKTQDMSNRSADQLLKNEGNDDKKEEAKNDIPTSVTQKKPKKDKKDKPKGLGFDTSDLVFICMGRLKYSGESSANANHFWIMTLDPKLKDIDFWEPMNNKHYKLCDRIEFPEIMRKYIKGELDTLFSINDAIRKRTAKEKVLKAKANNDQKKKAGKSRLAKQLTENDEIDGVLLIEKTQNLLNEIDYMEQHTNIKLGTKFENLTGNSKVEEEFLIHNNLVRKNNMGAGDEGGDKKQKSAVVDHLWKPEYTKRKIKNDILPYKSIDVVFNKKNVWINLQHPDPVRILYDLYNNTKWHCVLKTKDDAGKELVWKNDIPTFYSFRNFAPAYSEDELDALKKAISKTVNDSIKTTRLLKNFPTKFKRASKEFSDILELYLIFLELRDLGNDSKEVFQRRIDNWKQFLLTIIPNKVRIAMLPLYFNYIYDNTISSCISDNCTAFLYHIKKGATFTTATKVFQYPNRVFSVRVLITIMYKISKEDNELGKEMYNEDDVFQTEKLEDKEVVKYYEEMERLRKLRELEMKK